jgi:small-conductance mechanosensitive channel
MSMLVRLIFALTASLLLYGQEDGVPVVIDGQEVARLYGSVGTFGAADRVPEIERRIIALAEKWSGGEIATRVMPAENATAVVAGPIIIMAVTALDADSAGMPQAELAQQYAAAIQKTMEGYRARHTWRNLLAGAAKTLLAWALFCISAWALAKAVKWFAAREEHWFQRQAAARESRGFQLVMWERGKLILLVTVKFMAGICLLSEFSFVISYTFGLFPATAGISTTLWDYLGSAFGRVGMAVFRYLPSGGFVVVVCLITRYTLRVLKFVAEAIERGELPVKGLHPEMARPTYQLARLAVVLFALVVAFPYLPGGQSDAFKGISIFLGLLLSLGSSSAVSNVLAGLVLTYMRPYRAGDRVKIADTTGDILQKSLLVTRLRTIKNVEVVIPNGSILSSQILNYSALARTRGLILNTTVTIGYDAPWRTVRDLLVTAALHTEGILPDPAPFVLQTSLNDFHISYELNAYTDRANDIQDTYSKLHEAIQDSFNAACVEIMSPTFYALRDGNTVTIPAEHRAADYEAPSFRVGEITHSPRRRGDAEEDAEKVKMRSVKTAT